MKNLIIFPLLCAMSFSCAYDYDCKYKLPGGYALIQDGHGDFVVKEKIYGEYINYDHRHRHYEARHSDWSYKYSDSCRAKGIAKGYILSITEINPKHADQ